VITAYIKCEVGYLWPQKEHRISETLKYNILFGGNSYLLKNVHSEHCSAVTALNAYTLFAGYTILLGTYFKRNE
jgi:hypothetical protein